jgi:predicted nucleotidyltransferase
MMHAMVGRQMPQPGGAERMTAEVALDTMVDRIVTQFHPRRVVLFGSRARGTATAESDVDLLVVMDGVTDKRQTAIEIRRALSDLPVCKDIIVTTPEEIARRGDLAGSVLRPALREGKVLYEQS